MWYERIAGLRKLCGMSEQEAANRLNISLRAYRRYERGTVRMSLKRLVEFADLFAVSLDYLLGLSDDPAPPHA